MSGVHGQDGDEGGYGGGYGSYEGGGGGGYGGRGGGGGGYGGRGGGGGGYGGRGGGGGGGGAYGGGYQGDRGGRGGGGRGGGRGGGSGRDGDWRCPNPSCGNLNFARRTECNKCGVPSPASSDNTGGYNRGGRGGGGYENNRGGRGNYNDSGSGRGGNRHDSGSGRGSSYGHNQGRDDGGHGQDAQAAPPSYGGSTGNYGNPPRSYGGNSNNTSDTAPHGYMGGPTSYPPSYGNPAAYDRNAYDGNGSGGRGGSSGYGSGGRGGSSGYGGAPRDSGSYDSATEEFSEKVKQCDETCGDSCDNARIYISNLPPDVTVDELRELFGSIGQVARIKQKRGYKDQWPWSIKIYTDEQGNSKGDAVLSYEDPSAAHSAGGFFNNHELKGHKISVSMAEKSAPKAPSYGSGGRGNYGGGRRDTYRDGGSSGPDRHYHGGNRSRPY